MTVRNFLEVLPAAMPIGDDCEVIGIGVRYDPDVDPPVYQPLLQARKKSAGSEVPTGTMIFVAVLPDGSPAASVVTDASPFDAGDAVPNSDQWFEWEVDTVSTRNGHFKRTTVPVEGLSDISDDDDKIPVGVAGTRPGWIRFRWRYTG